MSYRYIRHRGSGSESRCEFERTLKGEYCPEGGEVRPGSLRLCNRHAERLRLEERVNYCQAILAHIELWSGEARGRGRGDVVHLLELERERTSAALARASEALEKLDDLPHGEVGSGNGRAPPLWPPLILLGLLLSILPKIGVGGRPS